MNKMIPHKPVSSAFELRRLSVALFMFCCLGLVAACNKDPNKEKVAFVQKGQQYLKEKKPLEARIEFRNALLLDKRYADAWYGLGEADLLINNLREAFDGFAAAEELDPNNLDARVKLANLYLQYIRPIEQSIKQAEDRAKAVLSKDPNHIEGHILMASVRTSQKRWDEARAELDKAVALDPKRSESYLSLARYFDQRGKESTDQAAARQFFDEAEKTYRQAIGNDPKSVLSRLALSDFYYTNSRKSEAEQELRRAFEIDPNDKLLLAALQRFYENQQNFGEAEKYAERLAGVETDRNNGRMQLIDLHARAGKVDQAIQEYEQLIKDSPKFMRSYSRLAELLLGRGDIAGATQRVSEALTISRQDTDALLVRGRIHLLNGRFGDAERDLAQVLKNEPSMPTALYFMAETHLQSGEPEKAGQYISELMRFYPQSPMGLMMQIRIYLNQNRPQEAIKRADEIINGVAYLRSNESALQASRLSPESLPDLESKAYTSRAVARLQMKDLGGAQADFERATTLDQKNAEPHTNLALVHLLKNDLARAQAEAEKALELGTRNPQAINTQAVSTAINVYVTKRDFATAHNRLDTLLAAQPDHAALLDQKAYVFLKQGDLPNYEKTLLHILEKKPDYLNAYFELSQFYLAQNQADRAIAQLQEVLKRRPDNQRQMAQAYLMTGLLEDGRGRYDEAAKMYELSLSYDKKTTGAAIAYNNLAWLMVERIRSGNQDKAADYARSAIAITPEASFYDTLGWIYYKKGLYTVAIEQFNKAIEKNPKSASYHYHLARALNSNNDSQKARDAYEMALRLGGDKFPEAKQAREELSQMK
jgi:tetratricopeptide (TPR) repeat protein